MLETGGLLANDLVADEQPRLAARARGGVKVDERGPELVHALEHNARQGHAGVAVRVAGKRDDSLEGRLAEQADGERRSFTTDSAGGDDTKAWLPLEAAEREQGELGCPLEGRLAEQADGERRSFTTDSAGGDDTKAWLPLEVDDRQQGDIGGAATDAVEKAAGDVERKIDTMVLVQPGDEWPRVHEADAGD